MRGFLALALLGVGLAGCGSDDESDLEDAKKLWEKSGIEHYELWAMDCSWGECTGDVHVRVDETGVSAERISPENPENASFDPKHLTVESYFNYVKLSIQRGDIASIEYDDELGYVQVLSMDNESHGVLIARNLSRLAE